MRINPYLFFNGQCEEAFKFYEKCLGGQIGTMIKNGESPIADETRPELQNQVLHTTLIIGDEMLMGSDSPPEYYERARGSYVSLNVDEPAEAERIFKELAHGGEVRMQLETTFWARRFGMVVDRFGTPWMVNCA